MSCCLEILTQIRSFLHVTTNTSSPFQLSNLRVNFPKQLLSFSFIQKGRNKSVATSSFLPKTAAATCSYLTSNLYSFQFLLSAQFSPKTCVFCPAEAPTLLGPVEKYSPPHGTGVVVSLLRRNKSTKLTVLTILMHRFSDPTP